MVRKTDERLRAANNVAERTLESRRELRHSSPASGREAWLWKNEEALALVQSGIKEAKRGHHAKPPNLAAAKKLVAVARIRALMRLAK
jgi:hypothetical protein